MGKIYTQKTNNSQFDTVKNTDKDAEPAPKYAKITQGTLAAMYGINIKPKEIKPTELSISDMIQYSNKNQVSLDELRNELLKECAKMRENDQWEKELANKAKKRICLTKLLTNTFKVVNTT